jgi:hypothetical protein
MSIQSHLALGGNNMAISNVVLEEIRESTSGVLSILEDLDETATLHMAEGTAKNLSAVEGLDKESVAYALDHIGYSMMKTIPESMAVSLEGNMFLLFTLALQVIAYHLLDD